MNKYGENPENVQQLLNVYTIESFHAWKNPEDHIRYLYLWPQNKTKTKNC